MRITYLHQYFNTPDMAGGTRSYELARRLVAMGHEVNMITAWREGDGRRGWFETEEAGIRVHWLPVPYGNHMGYRERVSAFLRFAVGAARKAASIPTDVVFATSTPLTIALPGVWAKRKQQVPMVFEVRDLWPQVPIELGVIKNPALRKLTIRLEKWAYQQSAAVVALAPGMKRGVEKAGKETGSIAVIPNGVDCQIENKPAEKERAQQEIKLKCPAIRNGPLLVYCGTFGFVNDIESIVNIAQKFRDIDEAVNFAVIGDGAKFEAIGHLAHSVSVLNKNLFLLGKLSKNESMRWLLAADAHLVFYKGPRLVWEDCTSNKLFDAMAYGKPIISNIPGWGPLLAQEKGAGLVLDSVDALEIASAINQRLKEPGWLQRAGDNSYDLGRRYFNRNQQAVDLERVLQAAVDGKGDTVGSINPLI